MPKFLVFIDNDPAREVTLDAMCAFPTARRIAVKPVARPFWMAPWGDAERIRERGKS